MRKTVALFLILFSISCLCEGQNVATGQRNNVRNTTTTNNNNNNTRVSTIEEMSPGGMTDEELMQLILKERDSGRSQKEILTSLLKKGVSTDQINRIRKAYLSNQKNKNSRKAATNEEDLYSRKRQDMDITSEFGYFKDSLDVLLPDSVDLLKFEAELNKKIKIFGHNIFKDKELNFEPNLSIATPDNYKLGPGDEVIIEIWGASQSTFNYTITPDGYINIENQGLVYINGMTVKEASEYLKNQFGQIYAGITSEDPSAQIKLILGQVRSIQVRVMGEVENPGTYTLSSFASIFHALYQAGGVNDIGTLRDIKLYRANKEILSLDVYDYLLNGKTGGDVLLADGDVVSIDTYDCLVNIEGKVKRPMYYEMKPSESVADLMRYAGGFAREAYRKDIRLVRVGEVQKEIYTLDDAKQKSFFIQDGDVLSVDSIQETYANLVETKGAMFRPGKFQIGDDIKTIKDIIQKSGGLRQDAFLNRAILNRRLPDLTMENLSVDLKGIIEGTTPDVKLKSDDVLYIPSISDVTEPRILKIHGEVAFPGTYRYAENTTIEELIIQAGGLKDNASTAKVDVARRQRETSSVTSSDTIARIFTFSIDKGLVVAGNEPFYLQPYDAVYIRRSPGYYEQQNVEIRGEVTFAGTYVINKKNMRLSDVIKSAGGLTSQSYPKGARLERKMTQEERARALLALKIVQRQMDSIDVSNIEIAATTPVGIELDKAMAQPGSDADMVLQDGDRLIIPQFTNTVKVGGNVMFPNSVAFKKGEKLKYYIEQSGGYGMDAKKSKAIIVYMNGTVAKANKGSNELIQPGCEIIVPTKLARKGMSTSEIFSLSSTSASLATVVLALINLMK